MVIKYDLQFFGGRGSSSGLTNNNIISFKPRETKTQNGGWDYKGESERVEKLINNANAAKTVNSINKAAMALKKEDEHITTLLNNVKQDDGDARALMTLRRRIREQRKKTRM